MHAFFNNRTISALITLMIFFAVIGVLSLYGHIRRITLQDKITLSVDSPDKAYLIWEEKKVRGRTLLLFSTYPHVIRSSDYEVARHLTPSNYIEFSAFNNIIRRVYFIVPDDKWEELRQQGSTGAIRAVSGMERGLYLYNLIGIPIIATTPSSLPYLSETTLVYINGRLFDEAYVRDVLLKKGITSDITIVFRAN